MGAVTLYGQHGCNGPSARLFWNPEDPEGGQYYWSDLDKAGAANDTISAIQVPRGYVAILYHHDSFTSEFRRIRGSYISEETQESHCINLTGGTDNTMTSMKIIKDKAAIGYWQAITSTESQLYSFHVGVNYENSEGTSTEIQHSITAGAELGIGFASASVEATYSHTLTQDV